MLDLDLDRTGYREVVAGGLFERNPLFRNFETDGKVSGYGIRSAGKIIENMIGFRNGLLPKEEIAKLMDPFSLGFYTSLICEGAHRSLETGEKSGEGVVTGGPISLKALLEMEIGKNESAGYYND